MFENVTRLHLNWAETVWWFFCYSCNQSWGLRPRSYDKAGLRPASVLVLQLWSWSWSWSYTFGLASNNVVHDKTLCDMIMLKCNKHPCSFV